jgi:hypothetical protein
MSTWTSVYILDSASTDTDYFIWHGSALTFSGVATFTLEDINSNALFNAITRVNATAYNNTATATSVPMASIKQISGDFKTITVNVITGKDLLVLGDSVQFAPDNTQVDIIVIGY